MATSNLPGNKNEERDDEEMNDAETSENISCDPLEMEKTKDGYRLVIVDVPAEFFGYIIGVNGKTKKTIELETGTQIHTISRPHESIKEITIRSKTKQGVSSAKTRIDVLVATARQKTRMTHFVAIPLNSKEIMDRFQIFKEEVLQKCKDCSGVDEEIFQTPLKLHLTIVVMVLLTEQEVIAAQEILDDCLENIINPMLQGNPLLIEVAGLGIMNANPGKVRVLYGKVRMQDGTDRLQDMANRIRKRFASSELCQDKWRYEGVKLHMTLMNSIKRAAIDAREILDSFGDFSFGKLHIKSVHLADKGRIAEDGSYWAAGKVPLP